MRKILLLVFVALGSAGCGSSTASKTYSFAGEWQSSGAFNGFFLDVAQTGQHVSGQLSGPASSGTYGPISGTVANGVVSFSFTDLGGIYSGWSPNASGQFTGHFSGQNTVVGTIVQGGQASALRFTRLPPP